MSPRPAVALLVLLFALPLGSCRGVQTFLVDADVDDDGVVTTADVAAVTACLGVEIPLEPEVVDVGGCPLRPTSNACAGADVDRDGLVTPVDVALVTDRLDAVVCNGSELLCDRGYDDVAYATTHNAMAARFDPYFYSPITSSQCSGVPTQLEDGIRGLMLDIHLFAPPETEVEDLYLCHSDCDFGAQLLVDGLAEVRAFLDARAGEIVTFIIETNGATGPMEAAIRDAFVASGLAAYAHVQAPNAAWPTLGEMVAADRRLVVLTDDSSPQTGCNADGNPCPWYHSLWNGFAFETPFQSRTAAEFVCSDLRGAPGDDLFILNHFLTQNIGQPRFARQVNVDPLLSRRARECWAYQGQIPNFPTVDFYEIGRVVRTTNLLNYLWGQSAGASPPP